MHDLNRVALGQRVRDIAVARDDRAVHFDGNAPLAQPEMSNELGDRQPIAQALGLSIDRDVHRRKIVFQPCLYNLGGVW